MSGRLRHEVTVWEEEDGTWRAKTQIVEPYLSEQQENNRTGMVTATASDRDGVLYSLTIELSKTYYFGNRFRLTGTYWEE